MLYDDETYNKSLLADHMDSELVPDLRDPTLLKAFATLEEDLRMVVGQIASDKGADKVNRRFGPRRVT
jgi:hypothetical protein